MKTTHPPGRPLRFCLVVLLTCLLNFTPRWAANAVVSSANGSAGRFHISGRYLLDANNTKFVMRGINIPYAWYTSQTSAFQHAKAKGANTVRVVLSSGQTSSKTSATNVADVIRLCKANKLICILEVHDTTGYGELSGAASLSQAVSYWKEIKSVLVGEEAYVLINLGNEPYGNYNTADWVQATQNAIGEMRNAGFEHTLVVDAPNWGQDWQFVMRDHASDVLASDTLANTIFSIHMYAAFDTAAKVNDYLSKFVNANLPLIIGEFGYDLPTGGPDEDAIMAAAQWNEIGYLGWSWSGNSPDSSFLDMVTDFDPNQETWWGNRIIHGANGIATTSQQASVYDNASLAAVTTGVFRPSNGLLYLKNSNTTGFADVAINYGRAGDYPVAGDWDGNATATIGIYRNGTFYLRNSNTVGFADWIIPFGQGSDQPIAGDWDGNGTDTIGIYRPSTGQFLLRNGNSAGPADISLYLGNPGDVGIAGDWNGDGIDTVGVFRPSNGIIFLKNTNSSGYANISLNYGTSGDKPVVGDWNDDGIDTIGVYRQNTFFLRDSNTVGFADYVFSLGIPGDMPIAGNWDGKP